MAKKCSVPSCAIDDSGDVFTLFHLPTDSKICAEWQKGMCLLTNSSGEVHSRDEIYVCEVHFDKFCWDDTNQRALKASAVPCIFQHSFPLEYVDKLYIKLKSANMCQDIVEQGIQVIKKLKPQDILGDSSRLNELVHFTNLLGVSAMQKIRIDQKSSAVASIEMENNCLRKEVNEVLLNIESKGGF